MLTQRFAITSGRAHFIRAILGITAEFSTHNEFAARRARCLRRDQTVPGADAYNILAGRSFFASLECE